MSKNRNGQPLPFPSQCKPDTYKKMPEITRGSLCEDIKNDFSSLQDISNNLADNKQLFKTIVDEYTSKYKQYLKFPSDQTKGDYEAYEQDWLKLKELIKENNDINTMMYKYQERVRVSMIVRERNGRTRYGHRKN